ncbi:hypothetical protein LPJ75_001093 [Coemansia sp. RSA 2598]|nr:hypothetical protein LPJ75_001093 [Coemansia sp. RSA 2598]
MSLRRTNRATRPTRADRRPQRSSQAGQDSQAEERNRMHADFFRNIVTNAPEPSEQQPRRPRPRAVLGSAASEADFTQVSDAIESLWDRIVRSSREETADFANIGGARSGSRLTLAQQQPQQQLRPGSASLYSRNRQAMRSSGPRASIGSLDDSTVQADGWTFVNMRPRTSAGSSAGLGREDGFGPSPPRARRRLSSGTSRISVRIRRPSVVGEHQRDQPEDRQNNRDGSGEEYAQIMNINYINFNEENNRIINAGNDAEDAGDADDADDAYSRDRYSGYNAFDSSLDQGPFIFFNSDDVDEEAIGYSSEEPTDDGIDDDIQAQMQGQEMWAMAARDNPVETEASDFGSWLENTLRDNPWYRRFVADPQSSRTPHQLLAAPSALPSSPARTNPQISIAVRQHWNNDRVWKPYIYKQLVPNSEDLMRDTQNEAKQNFVRGMGHELSRLYCVHSQVHRLYAECTNADDMGRGTLYNIFSSGRTLFVTTRPENVNLELSFSPDHASPKHYVVERIMIQSSRALHTPCTEIMVFASSRRCSFEELKKYDSYTFAQYEKLSANLEAKNKGGLEIADPRPIAYFWLEFEESYKQLQLLPQGVPCRYLYFKLLRGLKNSSVMSLRSVRIYGWDGPRAFAESALC